MKKIITIIGARPQFIKLSPVSSAIRAAGLFEEVIVHTGQHYDPCMSSVFFSEMEITPPHYNLEVKSGSHAEQTAAIMTRLEPVISKENPDAVIVFGDTNSTLAGALVAAKMNVPLVHIEAGLRSFNRRMPEEINRVLTDHASTIHFAPTTVAVENLQMEGIIENVYHVGDVMYDAALRFAKKANYESSILDQLSLQPKGYYLVTIHRAENTDNAVLLEKNLLLLQGCSLHKTVVFPLHPRTRKMIDEYGLQRMCSGIHMIDPVGFIDMVNLESNAACILTDSGGVQKEAYFHRVPCITLRAETEWIETVNAGWNRLMAPESIVTESVNEVQEFISVQKRGEIIEYGDGKSAEKIVKILNRFVNVC